MNELLGAVLQQCKRGMTSADVLDAAAALALDSGWTRDDVATLTIQRVAAGLRGMYSRGEIEHAGSSRENGRDVPKWKAKENAKPVDPPPPPSAKRAAANKHPLTGRDRNQHYAIFNVLDLAVSTFSRLHAEHVELVHRQRREITELADRVKRELVAAGVEENS